MFTIKVQKTIKHCFLVVILSSIIFSCSKDDNDGKQADAFVKDFTDEINADSLQKYTHWLQDMGTRFALAENRKDVALKIKNQFIRFGYTNTILDSFYITKTFNNVLYNVWQYNVIATLDGVESPDSICIIGSHYDSYSKNPDAFTSAPGANDNASGVAAAIEIARVMKKKGFTPRSTIQFIAFGAEELGLLGSRDFANEAASKVKKIKMMLNNDMIAYWPVNIKPMRVNIIDYPPISKDLREKAELACKLYTSLETNNDNTYQKSSDSYYFFLNGYSSIFFISDGDDTNYHTTNDVVSNCNFEFCKEVTKVSCALLVESNKL